MLPVSLFFFLLAASFTMPDYLPQQLPSRAFLNLFFFIILALGFRQVGGRLTKIFHSASAVPVHVGRSNPQAHLL
jgi:hypothetical protein